ncbi:kinase-like domain-containing protein [Naematelia encephala]|uniref:Kinase-like domain-containing protein n=1 Tax=Naematelia encephala TaxID=71784 RepID=A0A1Y2AK87_9TREE|nr:kinase-like domain-containing protein [Naematelia encephala]
MGRRQVPESQPAESQFAASQRVADYAFEATQLSQPHFSQTQNTQNINSQIEPRRKYWAILIPTNSSHSILKIPWTRASLQLGRGPPGMTKNDVMLHERRVSNVHCRFTLGLQSESRGTSMEAIHSWKEEGAEPEVWLEDLKSSNGTFVNGEKLKTRRLLQHGDEISLGHASTLDNHEVRYIFRSVGSQGSRAGTSSSAKDMAGEVYERYQLLDRLGKGTFAEVRKAVDVETGDLRAIKQIVKHRFAGSAKTLELFQREIAICRTLEHENICQLIEWYEDPQHICLVLEYIDGGDLLDHIMNWPNPHGGIPEAQAADFGLQICRAMAYTHAQGVTHRDLKPENILLTKETPDNPRRIKVADFGLAKMVHAETMLVSMVGTPQYLAPEVVMQDKFKPGYENKVDCWSVGIIVYSMMTKALPFDEDADAPVDKRIRARYTQQPDMQLLIQLGISQLAIDFISRLLEKQPSSRMSMNEALDHEWLAGPSSQHSESQRQVLGGDSMWDIQSFDQSPRDDLWTRPMTVSGTNLESAFDLDSSESFSQPLEKLPKDKWRSFQFG